MIVSLLFHHQALYISFLSICFFSIFGLLKISVHYGNRLMDIVLDLDDVNEWVYRGEGAANLVLAYTGLSPAFIGKVMRIHKALRNGSPSVLSPTSLSNHERLLWGDIEDLVLSTDKDIAAQSYVQHVMSTLLGPKHVDAGMRVPVTREFLQSVEENIISQRPAWRVDAGTVDTDHDSVLVISDHSLFFQGSFEGEPCISVEIKPKCGFLPFSRFIAEENSIKRSVTRFKMHQALKLHQGEISELSDYDPLDLFSGSKDQIYKAIKDLFSSPQNNFRVFLDGSLIFGALGGSADNTSLVTGEAFEDALKSVIMSDEGLRTMNFLELVAQTVYKSGVLNQLLEVQKFDKYDIEGAIHAYYDVISEPCMVCQQLDDDEIAHSYGSLHSMSLDQSTRIVKDFLIAATAKDCSLMISFRPRVDGDLEASYSNIYFDRTSQFFDYKVYFIDLDLKPLKKMEEYYELDKKILSCYIKMLEAAEKNI